MNKTKLGNIGIEDIPALTRGDMVKTYLPLMHELSEVAQTTDYFETENKANLIASNLQTNGGDIFFSKEAVNEFGHPQVTIAFNYLNEFGKSTHLEKEIKMAVLAWIADNIFDLEQMKPKESSAEEE